VAPVLKGKLEQILGELSASFPPAAACLRATAVDGGAGSGSAAAEFMDDSDDDMEGRFLSVLKSLCDYSLCWLTFETYPENSITVTSLSSLLRR
jgi:hypothetical protein